LCRLLGLGFRVRLRCVSASHASVRCGISSDPRSIQFLRPRKLPLKVSNESNTACTLRIDQNEQLRRAVSLRHHGFLGCDAGVFVSLTMAMSTLSVITTVLVLHLHHISWNYPLPHWIQTLAFDVLARALCMHLTVGGAHPARSAISDRRDSKTVEFVQMTSVETEVANDAGKMTSCGRAVDCFRCTSLCARIDDIATQLHKVDTPILSLFTFTSARSPS